MSTSTTCTGKRYMYGNRGTSCSLRKFVAARTTFRLEQWNRFANPESNAQSFGKLVTQADGTIYNYDGVASEVVNAQLRIERIVHA